MAPAIAVVQFSAEDPQAGLGAPVDVEVVPRRNITAKAAASAPADDRFAPHPAHAAAAPAREDFAAQGPVIATGHPGLQGVQVVDGNPDTAAHIPLNTREVELETAVFKGRLLLSVRGVPTTPAATRPGGPLAGNRRTFHVAVQGRFKAPIAASDLLSGQEMPKPPRLSAGFMHFILGGAAKVFAHTTDVFVEEGKPMHYHFPVLAAAQLINVSRPGEEPDLLAAAEDMTLWDAALSGRGGAPLPSDKRRAFFDKPSHLAGREIGTDLVWTMHITQSLIDFSTYKLGLPGVPVHIDLVPVLDAQPLQIMAKTGKTGDYVFNVLMWNDRLLHSAEKHDNPEEALSGYTRIKDKFKGLLGW
ncbi:hypothetical protein Rsub_12144 [Raphidocelis subcapitata]|uniref:Domain of unknown function at the cortex 1 domain-containing protein n=1 Tax=Raphidocelis subcapitata TaxID=307507 RepID=A0A2V0PIC9_9CHLO|nr:hypothetical protein Rsub_12144 [Raphidocelis subcapitata]|eukprot:GBF99476.1 hypothetical protein Rsub_12144 [Raphidocelis subcapitata]